MKANLPRWFRRAIVALSATPAVLVAVLAVHTSASAQSCVERAAALSRSWQREVPCFCAPEELGRITVTLPAGFRLQAACGLRKPDGPFIDLRRSAVDMDRYDASGNAVDGILYLAGTIVLRGDIRVEPSDGGTLYFIPERPVGKADSPFGKWLRDFRIADTDARKFAVPERLLAGPCHVSKATVRFRDLEVSMGETDSDGAFPRRVEVLDVGTYRPCERGQ